MIIIYDPVTLSVKYTVNQYAPEFVEKIGAVESFIEWDELASIQQIKLSSTADGIGVSVLPFMPVSRPEALHVGVEAVFSGVPEGASVSVNGELAGVMDAAGILEFTPEMDGVYAFRFEHPDFVTYEARLEALAI